VADPALTKASSNLILAISASSLPVAGMRTRNSSPPVAGEGVGVRIVRASRLGDGLEHFVARRVSEAVVDRLEAVDVGDYHREFAAIANAPGSLAVDGPVEAAAVEGAGERVALGDSAGSAR